MRVARFCFVLLPMMILLSCGGGRDSAAPLTWTVKHTGYVEKIIIPGTVEAVVNTPVTPPNSRFGQLRIERLAPDGSFVRKGDTICVLTIPDMDQTYDAMLSGMETTKAQIRRAEVNSQIHIVDIESQLAASDAHMQITFLDSLKKMFVTDYQKKIIELEMQKAVLERQKLERSLEARRMAGETEVRQLQSRLMQNQNNVRMMEDEMKSMTIIAQRDGIVTRAIAPKITMISSMGSMEMGGQMREGSVLFFATPVLNFPDLSRMQIKALVNEDDYRRIERGQEVIITVGAGEQLTLAGKVNRKNLTGNNTPVYSQVKVRFFEVIIDITDEYSVETGLMPGLSAECEIILRKEEESLFVPAIALFDIDSARVVYVKRGDRFLPVEVETGYAGTSFTVVSGGLTGGEEVALSRPPEKMVITGRQRVTELLKEEHEDPNRGSEGTDRGPENVNREPDDKNEQ